MVTTSPLEEVFTACALAGVRPYNVRYEVRITGEGERLITYDVSMEPATTVEPATPADASPSEDT